MTLEERIAKRKAEGWTLSCWHVRRGNGIYSCVDSYCDGTPRVRTLKHRYEIHQDALLDASKLGLGAVVIPVFTRTIKVKRGHSFSWALARMKEGKRVRMTNWIQGGYVHIVGDVLMSHGGQLVQWSGRDVVACVNANNWELAE